VPLHASLALPTHSQKQNRNFLNEPRCPGCFGDDAAAHLAWVGEMAGALKAAAPGQQVWSSTEGYFNADNGARCVVF
jgi:hypothetical protein